MPSLLPLVVAGRLGVVGEGSEAVVGSVARIVEEVRRRETAHRPRWLVISVGDAREALLTDGVRIDRCWDVAEAHRLLHGGWTAAPAQVWASLVGLDPKGVPSRPSGDLFDFVSGPDGAPQDDPDSPLRPDGHLRVDAFEASWATTAVRLRALADLLADMGRRQERSLAAIGPRAVRTAHSESAAALLCAELQRDGLPVDRATAQELIELSAGPRPTSDADAARIRAERDLSVLAHVPGRGSTDLRNPVQVRELLAAVGVTVPNTRAHVLEPFRATHPVVEALLRWRKDERITTTYGYRWLDDHVGADDRLRGEWSACDGAAGRMTAQNGLHNLPVPLRPAIAATDGHVFVRADLGQIEPRVLAVVSEDHAFAEATRSDDLYAPVAAKLHIERPVAKIAVLAAMYGQRSGSAGEALKDLERAYPVAMRLLDDAYAAGVARRPLRTFGGRLIALDRILVGPTGGADGVGAAAGLEPTGAPVDRPGPGQGIDAARGRFARNAIIQGAAAELFKAWAATVRHAVAPLGAQIVLCLHDELLVHAPQEHAEQVAALVGSCLEDSARRWSGTDRVRFVADTSVIRRWSEAKP